MTRSNPINPVTYLKSSNFVTVAGGSPAASSPCSAGSAAGEIRTLVVPGYAATLVVVSDQDINFSEYSDLHTYSLLKQNVCYSIPVGNMEFVYFQAVSGGADANLHFHFELFR